MTRKLKAYKQTTCHVSRPRCVFTTTQRKGSTIYEPLEWLYTHDQRVVFHRIENRGIVDTPDGPMTEVYIRSNADLSDPSIEIAALVGKAKRYRKSGLTDPQSPELWYWKDKFWLKAVSSSGDDYYHKKCWLVYEVQVADATTLLGNLTHHWQKKED